MDDQHLTRFVEYQLSKGLSAKTVTDRDFALRALERWLGKSALDADVYDLRRRLGRRTADGRALKRSSLQTERGIYLAFYAFAKKEGLIRKNPAKKLDRIRAPRGEARPYTAEQIERLLLSGSYFRTRAMILLGYYQGWRAGTIARTHGHDWDLDTNTVRAITKGGKVVVQPIHPVIRVLVELMPTDDYWFPARRGAGGPIRSSSVSDLLSRAKRRAGILDPGLTGHSLRHSFATDLVEGGVDIRVIQSLMGHSSLNSTQIYTAVSRARKDAAILILPPREIPRQSGRARAA